MVKKKKTLSNLDKYVILSITVMLVYSALEFIFSTITGVHHETLTTALYGAFGGELFLLAVTKWIKIKRG